MQAVHHWHSESLGSEAGVPVMNSYNLRESTGILTISLGEELYY